MSWTDAEQYRQLEQDYERELRQFTREETDYREAAAKNSSDPALQKQYDELAMRRRELEAKHAALRELRNRLAHSREEASQALS
jgi:hypothetical protein